jgi:hypothetical protein
MKTFVSLFKSVSKKMANKDIQKFYGHGAVDHRKYMHENNDHVSLSGKYQCPMKCEGEKLYDAPGNCPVCNMKLVPVGDQHSQSHHHHCC